MTTPVALLPPTPQSAIRNPQSAIANPQSARWYHLGAADIVFLVVALVVLRGAWNTMLDDPGLGWHLRNIDAMLQQGGWLHTDPFTEPGTGSPRPWRSNQWLGELPLWLGERWAGLEGIAVVTALVVALLARCLYGMLLRDGLPWPLALLWSALGALGTSCSWSARPNVFTILFMLLTARACVQFHQGNLSRRATLWLWPLFAVWANVHGGFVAGLIVLAATTFLETTQAALALDPQTRRQAKGRAAHLALLTAGAVAATFLNPYGPSLYSWVFQLLGEPYFMDLHQEWRSPDFHGRGALRFELLMLLFPLLLAVSSRRPNLVELGLAVLWLHFALTGFRYVALWVVVAVPLLARSSMAIPWCLELARRCKLSAGGDSLFATRTPGRATWAWSVLFALALLGGARALEGRLARHKPEIIAAPALDRFLEIHAQWRQAHGRRPVIFHSYDWGGYLTWHGWPAVKNWIDDRNEVQGKDRIVEYFAILRTEPGWEGKLDRAGVDLICVESGAQLTFRLAESRRWRQRYRDHYAVVFERVR
jgi:hypothetical protein